VSFATSASRSAWRAAAGGDPKRLRAARLPLEMSNWATISGCERFAPLLDQQEDRVQATRAVLSNAARSRPISLCDGPRASGKLVHVFVCRKRGNKGVQVVGRCVDVFGFRLRAGRSPSRSGGERFVRHQAPFRSSSRRTVLATRPARHVMAQLRARRVARAGERFLDELVRICRGRRCGRGRVRRAALCTRRSLRGGRRR